MWKVKEGSTSQLLQFCTGYFIFYVITGICVKYFTGHTPGFPNMDALEYLVYNTAGGSLFATLIVLILGWYKLDSLGHVKCFGRSIPRELLYIIPSGLCTAVVVPTTTLMYSFNDISVMVAMVVMRGMVIVIGRAVDGLQIRQGLLKRRVYAEENWAVVFALVSVGVTILGDNGHGKSPFSSLPVMVIFSSYIVAYAFRIYIMNYFKNTRPSGASSTHNNKMFFGIEQIASFTFMSLALILTILVAKTWDIQGIRITPVVNAVLVPNLRWWHWAMLAGVVYGMVAFVSVFIFMFKGRTATFANLVNRLTSLVAGTVATLLFALFWGGSFPKWIDWLSLVFILVAIGFLSIAEKKRAQELAAAKEIG